MALTLQRLLNYVDQLGLQPRAISRGWTHMGAVICDAGLQAGINYTTVVLPRLYRLVEQWPGAATTSAFVRELATDDLGAVFGRVEPAIDVPSQRAATPRSR